MTIADRIKRKREELSLTQLQLAKKCGYNDKTSITKIEKSGNDITLKKIQRVADALGVTPGYLMGWDEETTVEVPDMSPEEMEKAFDLFKRFQSLPPEKQAALQILLEVPQKNV